MGGSDSGSGSNGLSGLLALILITISFLNIRAGFYLNKRVGWISLSLWILPGVLSLLGYIPNLQGFGPDKFRFDANFTGSTPSAAANLIICLVAGWSFIMLFSAFWKKNTFKNAYDHVWYVLGLVTALYFVVDSGLPSYKEELSEAGEHTTLILQLYREGAQNLEALCKSPELEIQAPDLCNMVPAMRWGFQDHLDSKDILRARIDLPDWVASLASNISLTAQISALNHWVCSPDRVGDNCQTIPIEVLLDGVDYKKPLIFLPQSYAKELQRLHKSMQKADERIQEIERGHNARYFVFLMLAFVAGGKLANASRSMVKHDTVCPPSWLFMIIRFAMRKMLLALRLFGTEIVFPFLRFLKQSCRRVAAWCKVRTVRQRAEDNAPSE
ncbi:hypothetical protein DFO54_1284 [Erwinia sp. AG740]|nr:hypothetical protein DFO54_1284 [Erwinia sp. AG740]